MVADKSGTGPLSDQPPSKDLALEILRESRLSIDRQKKGISEQQRTLIAFIRYHLLFLAVLFSAVEFGDISISSNRIMIGSIVLFQFLGILSLLHAYQKLQSSIDGFDANELLEILRNGRDEIPAIEGLINHNEHLYETNQEIFDQHRKYWYGSTLVLAFSFGALISLLL